MNHVSVLVVVDEQNILTFGEKLAKIGERNLRVLSCKKSVNWFILTLVSALFE